MNEKSSNAPKSTSGPKSSNARARIVTALIGIPIVALIVWRGGAVLTGVVLILALLAMRELIVACRKSGTPLVQEWCYPLMLLTFFSLLHGGDTTRDFDVFARFGPLLVPIIVPLILLTWAVISYGRRHISLLSLSVTTLSIFYVSLFAFLPLVARPPHGDWLIWMLLLGVWAGDTFAYFAGRAIGKHKLTSLSPGKTREGIIAGWISTVAVVTLLNAAAGWDIWSGAVLGALIGVAAPMGDLAESFWKRELGVKDLGGLLPGHGGVLDRCDSLLFAAPVVYLWDLLQIR